MQETKIYIPSNLGGLEAARSYQLEVEEVFENLHTTEQGLSSQDAFARAQKNGRNVLEHPEEESLLMKFIGQFKEPLILLLLCSALISLLMGELADAIGIFLAVLIVNLVGFIQEYKSEKSVEALKSLVAHRCHVVRDGKAQQIDAEDLVTGDVVLLEVGDRVPADLRLSDAISLQIDESILTGEPEPSHKFHMKIDSDVGQVAVADRKNMAHMGTSVVNGRGKGVVVATGTDTELGHIWEMVTSMAVQRTPLQEKMDQLGKQLSLLAFGIVGTIFLLGALQGKPLLQMFTIGVSLAVAAIPEGLPIVVTVTLALGVTRMAKRHAIVRKLPAVEALGATTVICSDKTGTLTKNEMTVRSIFTTDLIDVTGDGYGQRGDFFRRGIKLEPKEDPHLQELLKTALLCNNAQISATEGRVLGQPTEAALLVAAAKGGVEDLRHHFARLGEVPFSPTTKWMSVQYETGQQQPVYHVKGAVDRILERCNTTCNDRGAIIDLSSQKRKIILEAAEEMGNRAMRVIALASGTNLGALTFLGVVGIVDPPREEAKEAIAEVRRGGVKVVMITGDAKETAIAIARELDIFDGGSVALSYNDVQEMSEDQLAAQIDDVTVFYRMAPEHKMKIIEAYKKRGHIVAMTGDGVNDAPALKLADIGVAMGRTGTDVSKEASEMILVDDNFATIVAAIEEGKSIYNNIKNFLRFQLTTSIATLSMVASSTLFGLPLPLTPIQILWINIIMDGPPAQSLGVEPLDKDVMKKPPRDPRKPVFPPIMLLAILVSAVLMVVGTLAVFYTFLEEGRETRAVTMCFTTFVLFQVVNAFNCRSEDKSIFKIGLSNNKFFSLAVGGSLLLQLAAIYVPILQGLFDTESLSLNDLFVCLLTASSVLVLDEARKYWMARSRLNNPGAAMHDPFGLFGTGGKVSLG